MNKLGLEVRNEELATGDASILLVQLGTSRLSEFETQGHLQPCFNQVFLFKTELFDIDFTERNEADI